MNDYLDAFEQNQNQFLASLKMIDTPEIYARTLEIQTDFYLNDIRDTLKKILELKMSRNILDVGCGPGALAYAIQDLIDSREYYGVDIEPYFINLAQSKFLNQQEFQFVRSNILDFSPKTPFDILIVFAVLQHLPDTTVALQHLRSLLSPNGVAAFFDTAADGELRATPPLPLWNWICSELSEDKTQGKRKDRCLDVLELNARSLGFEIIASKNPVILVENIFQKKKFVLYSILLSEIFRRIYHLSIDQTSFLNQLLNWQSQDNSRIELMGGKWIVVQKR